MKLLCETVTAVSAERFLFSWLYKIIPSGLIEGLNVKQREERL